MKTYIKSTACILLLWMTLSSCEENQILPSYQKLGTATQTVASISSSTSTPAASSTITLTLKFINPASDPIKQIVLKSKVGTANYTDVQTLNEESSPKDQEITREIQVTVPATPGSVVYDMVIHSQREYPQILRTTVNVQ